MFLALSWVRGLRANSQLAATTAAVILAVFIIPTNYLFKDAGDGAQIIATSTSLLFDRDLDYRNEAVSTTLFPNNQPRPNLPIGASLMALPILAPFAALDVATENPIVSNRSEYATSYLSIGWRFAALAWLLISLVFLQDFLAQSNSPLSSRLLFLLVAGSGIGLYYVYQVPEQSQVYSFASFVVVGYSLFLAFATNSALARIAAFALYLLSFCVATLVRPESVFFVVVWVVACSVFLVAGKSVRARRKDLVSVAGLSVLGVWIWTRINLMLYGIAAPLLGLRYELSRALPAEALNQGHAVIGIMESLNIEASRTSSILLESRLRDWSGSLAGAVIGPEVGVLWFAPIIAISALLAGAALVFRTSRADVILGLLVLVVIFAVAVIVIYWRSSGRGYGMRYAFHIVPFAILLLARLLNSVPLQGTQMAKRISTGLAFWSIFGILAQMAVDTVPPFLVAEVQPFFFARESAYVPQFAPTLFFSLAQPSVWWSILAARSGGFFAVLVFPDWLLNQVVRTLPSEATSRSGRSIEEVVVAIEALSADYIALGLFLYVASIAGIAVLLNGSPKRKWRIPIRADR